MPYISFENLVTELKKLKSKKLMLTFHSLGDTDAVASAIVLAGFFPNCVVSRPDEITTNSARILKKLNMQKKISPKFLEDADAIILFDANDFGACGSYSEKLSASSKPVIIIDHHELSEDYKNALIFDDEGYNSTASIVYELTKRLDLIIDENAAKLLSMGIISDSAEFKNASAQTFAQLSELFKIGKTDYISLLTEMEHISPPEDRMASIKDVMGSRIFVYHGVLFVVGRAHSHPNISADDAIKIGADISIFSSLSSELSFSARLRPTLDKTYRIHLGLVMQELAHIINGNGGGHPCAAGAYSKELKNEEGFTNAFIDEIKKLIDGASA